MVIDCPKQVTSKGECPDPLFPHTSPPPTPYTSTQTQRQKQTHAHTHANTHTQVPSKWECPDQNEITSFGVQSSDKINIQNAGVEMLDYMFPHTHTHTHTHTNTYTHTHTHTHAHTM
jgi:hypothetical protein